MSYNKKIRIGSRKSELALIQTRHVISLLSSLYPEIEFEIVTMTTLGDKVLDIPLPKIGEKSLFTKELETALATGCVDLVVHSLKDLPTVLPEGMAIGAVLKREDPRDALVIRRDLNCKNLSELHAGSVIGTSSLRRTAQLSRKYPNLKIENIRGNLNTRLRKLDDFDKYHAIILAQAGLTRMGWHDRVTKILDFDEMLYAVGQGAIAVECRENSYDILNILQAIHDPYTLLQVVAERSFLRTLGGGCSAPVAVSTSISQNEDSLTLQGGVWSLNGQIEISEIDKCTIEIKRDPSDPKYIEKNTKSSKKNDKKKAASQLQDNNLTCAFNIPCKRQRLLSNEMPHPHHDMTNKTNKINLMNDPHDQCPVAIPIGADFMGKCPYLDGQGPSNLQSTSKCPVNPEILTLTGSFIPQNLTSCPYLIKSTISDEQKYVIKSVNEIANQQHQQQQPQKSEIIIQNLNIPQKETKLYVGIYPSKKTPLWALEQAEHLGKNLADKLIQKGAAQVMAEAQKEIRGN